jgi:carbon starvation protein
LEKEPVIFADWSSILWEEQSGHLILKAMPVMLIVLCILAIAYRYYSAFLAARVAALDDSRTTPAHTLNDGQNYHPTNRWVLFGHHFAAISGAGPLIGPVLAIQFGYMPGLLWLVIGVCLAGAVQDMLVLAASVRREGKSLAEIARAELGSWASMVVSVAILFIVIIALAGLGIVVVKALGGEEVRLDPGMEIKLPAQQAPAKEESSTVEQTVYRFPAGCEVRYSSSGKWSSRSEDFLIRAPADTPLTPQQGVVTLPAGAAQIIPGSSWGTFTIACTIPIALLVSLWMYKIRKGRIVEASLLGALGVIAATIAGNWIPGSPLEPYFSLSREYTILALMGYGFIASVLPVWLLLCPRDYLSSFLKIGTIFLLVVGILVANPGMRAPAFNEVFADGGPTFKGSIFPFVFICIMCGAVSGFHALVSSGTTPKMINRERDIRPIGYGAMLMEGLVGVVALIAAASLEPRLYFEMNTDLSEVKTYQPQLNELYKQVGSMPEAGDPMHQTGVTDPHLLPVPRHDLGEVERMVGGESLRGRTGGAVTLAVGMALIFTDAMAWTGLAVEGIMKYWYHFAIMFEALFILTTIDTGTRIARFLIQEAGGKINPAFGRADWLPGAILSTLIVTGGWGALIWTGSISTIWPMFGIANQILAVIALCLVTNWLIHSGKAKYAWVTILPMLWVITTTFTAGAQLVTIQFPEKIAQGGNAAVSGILSTVFTVFVMACVSVLLLLSVSRWVVALRKPGGPKV